MWQTYMVAACSPSSLGCTSSTSTSLATREPSIQALACFRANTVRSAVMPYNEAFSKVELQSSLAATNVADLYGIGLVHTELSLGNLL